MASYAPLLANSNPTSWDPDLIYFTNETVVKTVNYYVQQLFASNEGDLYYSGVVHIDQKDTAVAASCVKDSRTGDVILKIVHTGPGALRASVDLRPCGKTGILASHTLLTGAPEGKNTKDAPDTVAPKESTMEVRKEFLLDIPPYSLQIIRVKK